MPDHDAAKEKQQIAKAGPVRRMPAILSRVTDVVVGRLLEYFHHVLCVFNPQEFELIVEVVKGIVERCAANQPLVIRHQSHHCLRTLSVSHFHLMALVTDDPPPTHLLQRRNVAN